MKSASATADVYKAGVLAAKLARDRQGTHFRYLPDYLAAGAPPVATTLPLTTETVTHTGGAVAPFFAGLLPEGRRLTALRTAIKASADDEFALLLAVGSDTIGDVQVVPEGAPPTPAPPLLEIPHDLSGFSFAVALGSATGFDRRGLPGVQDKASGRMINLPAQATGRDVILKLAPPEFPFVIENEAFFLAAAKAAGMESVRWKLVWDGEGTSALIVERFDRIAVRGQLERLAFEDAAQVLGVWPADKYNVSLEEAVLGLVALTAAKPVAAQRLFQQVAFAVLTGNGDQHAKNLGVLATADGEWRASPVYDVPSTLPYGDDTLALTMSGSDRPYSRRKLLAFAAEIGLPAASATRTLDRLLARTATPLSEAHLTTLPFSVPTLRRLSKGLAYRRKQLAD